MGPEAVAIEGAYKAGGITLAVCLTLLIGLVWLFRVWQGDRKRADTLREGDHQQTRADLAVLQRNCTSEIAALNAARLADRKAAADQTLADLRASHDSLDLSASAGRDQADALEALTKAIAELRGDMKELTKEVGAMRAGKRT